LVAFGTTTTFSSTTAMPENTKQDYSRLSRGAVAGITVSSIFAITGAIIVFMLIQRRLHKIRQYSLCERPGPFDERQSNSDGITPIGVDKQSASRPIQKLQTIPGLRIGETVAAANTNNPTETPIVPERLTHLPEAQDAECAHELDGSATPPAIAMSNFPVFSPEIDGETRSNRWTPPQDGNILDTNSNRRWSINDPPTRYMLYPLGADDPIAEPPSPGISQVQPLGNYELSVSEFCPISPNPNAQIASSLIGGVSPKTPLMDKWHADDHASVGQTTPSQTTPCQASASDPAATLDSPINWPNPEHLLSSQAETASGGVTRSLTSATGGRGRYISPETAMTEGLSAGHDGRDDLA
jgi:hypothetical protein